MSAGDDAQNPAPNSRHACASCKHQRKKCGNDCILGRFFPANRADNFKEVHSIFGVKNMNSMLTPLSQEERERAVESLEWEAFAWTNDPINGPLGAYRKLEEELELLKNQLHHINTYNAQAQAQQIMPLYQAKPTVFNRNPVAAAILAHTNNINHNNNDDSNVATTFGYYTGTNFGGLDHVTMNRYVNDRFIMTAVPRSDQNQILMEHPPAIPPHGGQRRLPLQQLQLQERGGNLDAQLIPINTNLPKQEPLDSSTIKPELAAPNFNHHQQQQQQGYQPAAPQSDGTVQGYPPRRDGRSLHRYY